LILCVECIYGGFEAGIQFELALVKLFRKRELPDIEVAGKES